MTDVNRMFVYGTLKQGRPLDRPIFAKLRTNVVEATIKGGIYNLGWFPTIKLADKGTVQGEVHTFPKEEIAKILNIMDSIEGYNASDPKRGLYNRHIVDATLPNGKIVKAWAYEYNKDVDPKKRIKAGVWEPE